MGAKRAGASRLALLGAAVGTVAGIFMGLVGVLFMPSLERPLASIGPSETNSAQKKLHWQPGLVCCWVWWPPASTPNDLSARFIQVRLKIYHYSRLI